MVIKAEILLDTKAPGHGKRITTWVLTFPRFILAEFNTHAMLKKNAASCLSGNTELWFDLPKKGKKGSQLFKMSLGDFYNKWMVGAKERRNRPRKPIPDSIDPTTLYRSDEFSKLFVVNKSNLHRDLRRGILKGFKKDGRWYFTGQSYVDFWKSFENTLNKQRIRPRLQKMRIRCLNEDTKLVQHTHVTNVVSSGVKQVFRIYLEDGYSIDCTEDHRFLTEIGWSTLKNINLTKTSTNIWTWDATKIYTNGLPLYKDLRWLQEQKDKGKTLRELCDEYGWEYKPTQRYLESSGIFTRKHDLINETLQYKNEPWLRSMREQGLTCGRIAEICNTTEDRVKKSCKKFKIVTKPGTVLRGGKKRRSWNYGKRYNFSPAGKASYSQYLQEKRRIRKKIWQEHVQGTRNGANTKIIQFLNSARVEVMEKYGWKCFLTGINTNLELHHIDPVWHAPDKAFDIDNLIVLNRTIHRRLHNYNRDLIFLEKFQNREDMGSFLEEFPEIRLCMKDIGKPRGIRLGLRGVPKNIVQIEYLEEQDTYDLEVEGPFHNFVANGVVVHNSRAIPLKTQIKNVLDHPFVPKMFTKNQPGMSAKENLSDEDQIKAKDVWLRARDRVIEQVKVLESLNTHKQHASRLLEPWVFTTVVCTATEWSNFFFLRNDEEAQPEFQELASLMQHLYETSEPVERNEHLPYVSEEEQSLPMLDRWRISAARCARVSYKLHDGSNSDASKDIELCNKLVGGRKPHFSPFEHQGICPQVDAEDPSFNLRGWIQLREYLTVFPEAMEKLLKKD